jgi:antitoxin MazE
MKLTKTSAGYMVEVPDSIVRSLGLHEGDDVQLVRSNIVTLAVTKDQRTRALEDIKRLARPLPPGYTFDRGDANTRR